MKKAICALAVAVLCSCDKAKNFIDPTGKAYSKPGDTASKSPAPASQPSAAASSPAPAAASGVGKVDVPVRMPAPGRRLTESDVRSQIPSIEFAGGRGSWTFRRGVGRLGGSAASWVDSAGRPWGVAVGDLDLDGSDDALLLVRWDRAGVPPSWELAFLRNQDGRLFNTQTISLPGADGFRELSMSGNSATLVPVAPGPPLTVTYSGGALTLLR